MSTDVPTGGPPAEPTDPTASVDQNAGQPQPGDTPVPATDLGGQVAEAPDTVGVDPATNQQTDQASNQTAPVPDNPAVQAGVGPEGTGTAADVPAEQDPNEATREQAIMENNPPRGAPVPNATGAGDFQEGGPTVNLLEDPDAQAVNSDADTVLVSLDDPVLGAIAGRWLERQAARDARLGPLVDRLQYLPGVRIEFAADDPIFLEAQPAQETATV